MLKYTTVIKNADGNYSACCPDLPGCIATVASMGDTSKRMKTAFELHIEGLKAGGLDIPPPATTAAFVETAL